MLSATIGHPVILMRSCCSNPGMRSSSFGDQPTSEALCLRNCEFAEFGSGAATVPRKKASQTFGDQSDPFARQLGACPLRTLTISRFCIAVVRTSPRQSGRQDRQPLATDSLSKRPRSTAAPTKLLAFLFLPMIRRDRDKHRRGRIRCSTSSVYPSRLLISARNVSAFQPCLRNRNFRRAFRDFRENARIAENFSHGANGRTTWFHPTNASNLSAR